MQWTRVSLVSQIALLVYLELIEWVNLFPWNDVRRGNGQAGVDFVIGAVMAAAILATVRRLRWGMAVAAALYAAWFWLQIDTWWIGYLRGAAPGWKRTYARLFSQTIHVLPATGDHLPPDACHLLLQLLILAALISTGLAAGSTRALSPSPAEPRSQEATPRPRRRSTPPSA